MSFTKSMYELFNNLFLCTLYWSSPHATPPSPPASPEKEANSQSITNTSSAALHKMLQQRLQQMNSKNLLLRNPITTVEVPTRPCSVGAKRKDSPPLPKPEIYGQMAKKVCMNPTTSPNIHPTMTPSMTSSSNTSSSPNQSREQDDSELVIAEDDDETLDKIVRNQHQAESTPTHSQSLPQIPKDLAAQIQVATQNFQQKKLLMPNLGMMGHGLGNLGQKMGHSGNFQHNELMQKLFGAQADPNGAIKKFLEQQAGIKQEEQNELDESDVENIDMSDSHNEDLRMKLSPFMNRSMPNLQQNTMIVRNGEGQYGNSPPTGATRKKMEDFISARGKMMDLDLLRQRFSNPLARPTLTKFVYALTRLLFTDDEIIAPLRDLDQEKIDWIFDETYRMFPGCTYPTVKNAVGQVGRTKRYRAKYALGGRQGGPGQHGGHLGLPDNFLSGLPSLLSMPTSLPSSQPAMPTMIASVDEVGAAEE